MNTTSEATFDPIAVSGPLDIEAIRQLANDAGSKLETINPGLPGLPESICVLIDRKSGAAKSIKSLVEEYRLHPARKSGTAQTFSLDSFIDLTNRHKTTDSVIFADTNWREPSLTTVVDYHENAEAGTANNGKHRIHYDFPLSEEWKDWVRQDSKPMDQKDFAQWIEDHLAELAAPTPEEVKMAEETFGMTIAPPNQMVTLSRGLQVHVASVAKNAVTLQSGEGEIIFQEEHQNSKGEKLQVPGLFILAVAPFFMGEVVRMPVRLRYRVSGGAVTWIFKLYRPDLFITGQIEADLAKAAEATALPHYRGKPEMLG